MLVILLVLLFALWFLNYIGLPIIPLGMVIFTAFGVSITLFQLLIFLIILALTAALPPAIRLVAIFLLFLWALSVFGLVSVFSLPDIVIFATIFAVVYYLVVGSAP